MNKDTICALCHNVVDVGKRIILYDANTGTPMTICHACYDKEEKRVNSMKKMIDIFNAPKKIRRLGDD